MGLMAVGVLQSGEYNGMPGLWALPTPGLHPHLGSSCRVPGEAGGQHVPKPIPQPMRTVVARSLLGTTLAQALWRHLHNEVPKVKSWPQLPLSAPVRS